MSDFMAADDWVKWLLAGGAGLLGLAVLKSGDAEAAEPAPAQGQAKGADVSHHQGGIDWNKLAGSIDFVFVKATEALFTDAQFSSNWAAAGAAGLTRGAYHFFRGNVDPLKQASYFVSRVSPGPADLLVLDVESPSYDGVGKDAYVAAAKACIDEIARLTGKRPLLYTYGAFWRELGNPDFTTYPLWIAHYNVAAPRVPAPWVEWAFWQTTDSGQLPGISGVVDLDVFKGSIWELRAFAAGLTS